MKKIILLTLILPAISQASVCIVWSQFATVSGNPRINVMCDGKAIAEIVAASKTALIAEHKPSSVDPEELKQKMHKYYEMRSDLKGYLEQYNNAKDVYETKDKQVEFQSI